MAVVVYEVETDLLFDLVEEATAAAEEEEEEGTARS